MVFTKPKELAPTGAGEIAQWLETWLLFQRIQDQVQFAAPRQQLTWTPVTNIHIHKIKQNVKTVGICLGFGKGNMSEIQPCLRERTTQP